MRAELQSEKAIEPSDILTPKELAARLKVDVSWVYERTRTGGEHGNPLPVLPLGRYLRFDWKDVCAWLRSNPRLVRKKKS